MNEIVGIHICPLCRTIVLEGDDRQADGFEVHCPICFDSTGGDPLMDDLTDALLDDGHVKTAVSNLEIALDNYIKAQKEVETTRS